MERFNGIYKNSFTTIFGIFHVVSIGNDVVLKQISQTVIRPSELDVLHLRRWDNTARALKWLKSLENAKIRNISTIYKESGVV